MNDEHHIKYGRSLDHVHIEIKKKKSTSLGQLSVLLR